jgi:hypothetical protein
MICIPNDDMSWLVGLLPSCKQVTLSPELEYEYSSKMIGSAHFTKLEQQYSSVPTDLKMSPTPKTAFCCCAPIFIMDNLLYADKISRNTSKPEYLETLNNSITSFKSRYLKQSLVNSRRHLSCWRGTLCSIHSLPTRPETAV